MTLTPDKQFIGTIVENGDKYYRSDDFNKMHFGKQNFSILQLNVRSLNKNIDYLMTLII